MYKSLFKYRFWIRKCAPVESKCKDRIKRKFTFVVSLISSPVQPSTPFPFPFLVPRSLNETSYPKMKITKLGLRAFEQ